HRGAGRWWPGAAGPAHLARRSGTEPAMDPVPHDRGVRAAQRPCRPAPRVGGRAHRGVAAGRAAAIFLVRDRASGFVRGRGHDEAMTVTERLNWPAGWT